MEQRLYKIVPYSRPFNPIGRFTVYFYSDWNIKFPIHQSIHFAVDYFLSGIKIRTFDKTNNNCVSGTFVVIGCPNRAGATLTAKHIFQDTLELSDGSTITLSAISTVRTYVSEMFAWYAGSLEGDTYFYPERHGMYFGGFGMKIAPARTIPSRADRAVAFMVCSQVHAEKSTRLGQRQ
jgi:hypothetical protein